MCYLALSTTSRLRGATAWAIAALLSGAATCVLEPVRLNANLGQINVLLILLVTLDLTVVPPRWRDCSSASRRRSSSHRSSTSSSSSSLASAAPSGGEQPPSPWLGPSDWAALPSDSARFWLPDVFSPQHTGSVAYVGNQSWFGLVHRAPLHGDRLGLLLWAVAVAATLAIGFATSRLVRGGHRIDALLSSRSPRSLSAPISWSHHWSWLLLAPVVLIAALRDHRGPRAALLLVLVVAVVEPYWWGLSGTAGAIADDSLTIAGALLLVSARAGVAAPELIPGTSSVPH